MAYTTIDNPELYFQTKTYTGNGTDDTSITLDGDENMQPDMVWMKSRSNSGYNHYLVDSLRGVTKALRPNLYNDEDTYSDAFKSFDSNGFTLDDDTSNSEINQNTKTYVAWCWKESATAGFDILTFTGNATSNQTISHNLSAVPKCFHIKRLDQASNWCSYHEGLGGANKNVFLNTTHASQTDTGIWNNTLPTSSVFSVGNNIDSNGNGASHVWYGWSEKQGFSKFGSYTGNGNADGPMIWTGMKIAYLLIKRTDSTGDWYIFDNKLIPQNIITKYQTANKNEADKSAVAAYYIDFLSNGFKLRGTGVETNASGGTYIYMAFAEAPFVNSNGVPCNAR